MHARAQVALTFGGTFFYALEYTLCERVYTLYALPLDARHLCFCTGAPRWLQPQLTATKAPANRNQSPS